MKLARLLLRAALAAAPVIVVVFYGLLVTSPVGEAAGEYRLEVAPDPRVELAALLARAAGDVTVAWPTADNVVPATGIENGSQSRHPAVLRLRSWTSRGFSSEMLVRLLSSRGPWPDLAPIYEELPVLDEPGTRTPLDLSTVGITPSSVDSFMAEVRAFGTDIGFDGIWTAARPRLEARAEEIRNDPTLKNLTARLSDFLGEPAVRRPVIVPTWYGTWKSPFAAPSLAGDMVRVIDRPSAAGRITPETSLSWICVKEFARPVVERLGRLNAARTRELSGYWDYFRQGVAATSTTGWEDCLNAHIFRAIDLRVRPQQDAVERELRISAALQAGLGMIRVVDAAMTGFDRSRGFYQKFTDYYPTLLESLVGLEARVRVERARLGLKVTATGSGIRIDEILKGYSAEQSDLKVGDVIVEAELRPVLTEEGLASIVQSLPLGKTIEVVVERQGKRLTLPVTLSKGRTEYEFFRPATPDLQTGQPAGSGSG